MPTTPEEFARMNMEEQEEYALEQKYDANPNKYITEIIPNQREMK